MATACHECGTALNQPIAPAKPREPIDHSWIGGGVRRAAILLGIIFLYLLSFGPVGRFCTKRSYSETRTPTGFAVTHRVEYPAWTTFVYAPAFALWNVSTPSEGPLSFYAHYLNWWMNPPSED